MDLEQDINNDAEIDKDTVMLDLISEYNKNLMKKYELDHP